jgi:hypothetical protein
MFLTFPSYLIRPNSSSTDQLHKAIKSLAKNGGFAELVFYLEACESGSMFKGLLEEDLGVYAITAANENESSWGEFFIFRLTRISR